MIERVQSAFSWLPEDIVGEVFWACVYIMRFICRITGISYEALNIWLFVIIQPALVLLFFVLWFRAERSLQIVNRVRDFKCSKLDT